MNHQRHQEHQEVSRAVDAVGRAVVDAGLCVHRSLGPGLLESTYEHRLAFELASRDLKVERQVPLPIVYRDVRLEAGYRLDLLVENVVIVELKSVDVLTPVHEAQVLTYLQLSGHRLAFLLNFNVTCSKTVYVALLSEPSFLVFLVPWW